MHTTNSPQAALEPLPVRRRKFSQKNPGQYRITAMGEEPRQIAASSAYEAFKLSGLKSAIKIERSFNSMQVVFGETQVQDETDGNEAESADETLHRNIVHLQRTHPVVSAHDLDTLMRYAREASGTAAPAPEIAPPAPAPEPTPAQVQPDAPAAAPLPAVPVSTAPETTTTNLAGVEVHQDGFDELIPATTIKHPAAKPADSSGSLAATSAALPPAQELSLEEVEKLLGGKE